MLIIEPEWVLLGADSASGRPEPELATRMRVEVDNGVIVGLKSADGYPGVTGEVRKLPGRLLLPGLVDVHSHAFQRAFRGHTQWRVGDRDDFGRGATRCTGSQTRFHRRASRRFRH